MSCRQDGLDIHKIVGLIIGEGVGVTNTEMRLVKAGADAMLEVLKMGPIITGEEAMKQATSEVWYRSVTSNKAGCWVFIPDEVKE